MKMISKFLVFIVFISMVSSVYSQTNTNLSPTETDALLRVLVTNMNSVPSVGDKVTFLSEKTKKKYSGITKNDGRFELLIPKGDTYSVGCMSFEDDSSLKKLSIPNVEGLVEFDYTLMYELPKVHVLENVYFNTGNAILKPESYSSLNNLTELMLNKKNLHIELSGHTDNVGDDASNMTLSKDRAETVKAYLIKKGIEALRIIAVGYGETVPVASNETPSGRQKNRRTEVKITKE